MKGLELNPAQLEHRQLAHQEAVATNFHEAVQPLLANKSRDIKLRIQQPGALGEIDDFIVETQHDLGRSIIIPQPPNFGKSFIAALCMDLAGVGKKVPATGERLRGLFFTPRTLGVRQALETFSWLTPHLVVEKYDSRRDQHLFAQSDIVALTYKAAQTMSMEAWHRLVWNRDIFGYDEIHRGLGLQTADRLNNGRRLSKPTIIAASSTPDFDEIHGVANELGIQRSTSRVAEREAIEIGMSNEAHLFALYTGEDIFLASKRGLVTEADVQPLAEREARNQLILDTMADMAENGRNGIVQLIPGDESAHARTIAERASQRDITDPRTGKKRKMIVKALGRFQSDFKNKGIIEEFKEGRIDALTFTKYLTETFDCPLGYVLSAAPLGSEVDARQLTGRGARFNDLPTIFITLIDKFTSRWAKKIWTFFDVFDEDKLYQGKIIRRRTASPKAPRPNQSRDSQTGKRLRKGISWVFGLKLSESVQNALDHIAPGTPLDELVLTRTDLETVPDGYIYINDLPSVREGRMTAFAAQNHLASRVAEDGRPLFIGVNTGHRRKNFVLASEAERIIRARTFEKNKDVLKPELVSFLEGQGWPRPSFGAFITMCEEARARYKITPRSTYLRPKEARKFLMRLVETPLVDPEVELALAGVQQVLGKNIQTSRYLEVMRRRQNFYNEFIRQRRRGLSPSGYMATTALTLEGMRLLLAETFDASKNTQLIGNAALVDTVITQAQENMRQHYLKRGIRPRLDPDAIEEFLAPYDPDYAPPLPAGHAPLDETYALSGRGRKWMNYAACNGQDPELFFHIGDDIAAPSLRQINRAKTICARCTVKGDCLNFALDTHSEGVAGGLTEAERRSLGEGARQWLKLSDPRNK